ncbi:MAG: hypothetical protein WBA74_19860 [Cyclobacteriaceae bacterium]
MNTIDTEIFSTVTEMNNAQKYALLDFADQLRQTAKGKEKYRREAMKQIRDAIAGQH